MMRRLWRHRLGRLLLVLAVAAALFVVATLAAAAYTERSSFCIGACHEMKPYGMTWEASPHHGVACVKCHIKPGAVELVKAKGSALREVYVHFAGQVKAPIAVTRHIPDATCRQSGCHARSTVFDRVVLSVNEPPGDTQVAASGEAASASTASSAAPTVLFSHAQHARVPLCIDCHDRVVHGRVPGRTPVDPASMSFCMGCHDGSRAPASCETCHKPTHGPRGACTDCHGTASWASSFKHGVTLGRRHDTVECEQCHTQASTRSLGFADGCVTCHAKRHKTVTEVLCAKCHVPTHFVPSTFKHPRSGCTKCHTRPHPDRGTCLRCHTTTSWTNRLRHPFALAGPHTTFLCEKCHTRGIGVPGLACDSCHHRPHPAYGSCLNCHTMTSFASHFAHPIALAGVHTSFPCSRCHVNGIGSPGLSCTSCHGSNHGGLTNCGQCHTQAGWLPTTFRHGSTGMEGWQSMACSKCHPNNQFGKVACSCHGGGVPQDD
jgi:nitrate/TMAO reductase-like tetraheme cytochrome c subunit